MKLESRNNAKKVVAYVSLALVALILSNNAIYLHTHKLPNGEIIVHAHPFNKTDNSSSPGESHKHSKAEFLFWASVDIFFPFLFIVFCLPKFERKLSKLRFDSDSYYYAYHFIINGRAPPAFASL